MKKILLLIVLLVLCHNVFVFAEETNRSEQRKKLESDNHGKWYVVWGHNYTERDWFEGGVAAAIAICTENPDVVYEWLEYKLEQNYNKIKQQLPNVAKSTFLDWLVDSLKSNKIITYQGLKLDAGFVTYKRWEEVTYHEPRTRKVKIELPLGGWTWGFETFYEEVTRKIDWPNWHQFYIRYQLRRTNPPDNSPSPRPVPRPVPRTDNIPNPRPDVFDSNAILNSLQLLNDAVYIGNNQYSWTAFVTGPVQSLQQVKSVTYYLHPSFSPNVYQGDASQFTHPFTATGWGTFELKARVYLHNGENRLYRHMLKF